jgi:16S rRNA (guanine527-N7)-methyltransferase
MSAEDSSDDGLSQAIDATTNAKLEIYQSLLIKWQKTLNLVGPSTLGQLWRRHFMDSVQLLPLAGHWEEWVDIGSGAGFPGMVVAIMASGRNVHLIESDKRKASFLREVSRETSTKVFVHVGRIEHILPELASQVRLDIISARALAPMCDLLRYAEPVLRRGGRGLFLKGKELSLELTDASVRDSLECELVNSVTERGAKVVIARHREIQCTHRLER